MARKWTEEQKIKQAELIRSWKPWVHSTGARTPEGKAKSSQNAHIGKLNKELEILATMQELADVQKKLRRLTARRGEWWNQYGAYLNLE